MNVLSLFDGISCGQLALNRAGIKYDNYYASEIDKNAIKVTQTNFPNTIQLGDVTKIKTADLPSIQLICAGSPCTSFSLAGKRQGMITIDKTEITSLEQYLDIKDRCIELVGSSYLFWEFVRILKEVKPKYFLLENVRMKQKHQDLISNILGVNCIQINSSRLSAQNRVRLYWTNIHGVTVPEDKNIKLKDIINEEYDGIWVYPRGGNPGGVKSYNEKSPSITTSTWQSNFLIYKSGALRTFPRQPNGQKRIKQLEVRKDEKSNCLTTHPSDSLACRPDGSYRKFTPEEAEALQTISRGYTSCLSNNQRFKCIGNGWTVDVIAHIFKNINCENL